MAAKIKIYGSCNICGQCYWKDDLTKVQVQSIFKEKETYLNWLCGECIKGLNSHKGVISQPGTNLPLFSPDL